MKTEQSDELLASVHAELRRIAPWGVRDFIIASSAEATASPYARAVTRTAISR